MGSNSVVLTGSSNASSYPTGLSFSLCKVLSWLGAYLRRFDTSSRYNEQLEVRRGTGDRPELFQAFVKRAGFELDESFWQ